jgi:hypothetical protein
MPGLALPVFFRPQVKKNRSKCDAPRGACQRSRCNRLSRESLGQPIKPDLAVKKRRFTADFCPLSFGF